MDGKSFMLALEEMEKQKGISKDVIIVALKDAIKKAYMKQMGWDDEEARIDVIITEKEINLTVTKKVVEDNSAFMLDDLEIPLSKAKKIKKNIKVGDDIEESIDVSMLQRITANAVKSILKQKLAEEEKRVLYEQNKDKVNEMITGEVEDCNDRGVNVTVGHANVFLSRKELIGDETFTPGEQIRMYVSNVSTSEKGPMIKVSRSDPGFLRRLFEEEVREIYDGTVIIKAIARRAGIRSKIAVYSNDPNVDCVGSCIGVNGLSIKRIVEQLGNKVKDKEKIDIIQYTTNKSVYILDCLKPANVTHIAYLDEIDEKTKLPIVLAIVNDGQQSVAIGRRGSNVALASTLTGYSIQIFEESNMASLVENRNAHFESAEEIREKDKERIKMENYERYLTQMKASKKAEEEAANKPVDTNGGIEKAKPQQISDSDLEETKPVAEAETKVEEKEPAPVEEKVEEVIQPKVVKTTTTLESLEKALESDKKKENFKATHKTGKRPHNITDKEQPHEEEEKPLDTKKVVPQMDIYTKEELEDLDNEELDDDFFDEEEDIDYDEYDKYYDDDDK